MPSHDRLTGQRIHLRRGVELQVCHLPGRSPAWVFLHGGLGNRFNWRSQYEFAADQGWEALVYDLAGHGDSRPHPRYSMGRHRRDLGRLLQWFRIEASVLCCHRCC
jgi:pimeloyl-ACP methyl ester carboxylesterase